MTDSKYTIQIRLIRNSDDTVVAKRDTSSLDVASQTVAVDVVQWMESDTLENEAYSFPNSDVEAIDKEREMKII